MTLDGAVDELAIGIGGGELEGVEGERLARFLRGFGAFETAPCAGLRFRPAFFAGAGTERKNFSAVRRLLSDKMGVMWMPRTTRNAIDYFTYINLDTIEFIVYSGVLSGFGARHEALGGHTEGRGKAVRKVLAGVTSD